MGGGLAGLKTALELADAGMQVTLLESRNSLGGRARSFRDPATEEEVDNGQHLFLSGYAHTRAFLKRIGTEGHLTFQERLRVVFVRAGGRRRVLDCPKLPSPWHMIVGLLRFGGLTPLDKLNLARVWWAVEHALPASYENLTVEAWLKRLGQGKRARRNFWDPLTVAALNEAPEKAAAAGLLAVLRVLMGDSWQEARLGMPTVGLGALYVEAAREALEKKGVEIRLGSPVAGIEVRDWVIRGVRLADGSRLEADAYVTALPPTALNKIFPATAVGGGGALGNLKRFGTSPIISVNFWLDRPITEEPFSAMIGSRFQWLFNRGKMVPGSGYVSLIMSAAHGFIEEGNESLQKTALEDLKACFPAAREARVIRAQVVREREATVSLTPELEKLRPGVVSKIENLFVAGDWVATGLPATIESAVLSGALCARELVKRLASETSGRYNMPVQR